MTADIDAPTPFERSRSDQAWARWLARSADALLTLPATLLVFGGLGVAVQFGRAPPELLDWLAHPLIGAVIGVAVTFIVFLLWEPLFISNQGSTPGKWLMGIRVLRSDGAKLSLWRALSRFVRVWFIGMGAGIPLVTLIAMVLARSKLVADGATGWDQSLDCRVEHRKRHPIVWLMVALLVVGVNVGLAILERLAV